MSEETELRHAIRMSELGVPERVGFLGHADRMMTPRDRAIAAALVAIILLGMVVLANAQGRHSDWYKSLRDANGRSCCDISDCAPTKSRFGEKGYQALTPTGEWVDVPQDKVIPRENPTGGPVMCWTKDRGVMCFVRDAEA